MPNKQQRYFLKAKKAKSVLRNASQKLKIDLEQILKSKVDMELIEMDFAEIFLINRKPLLVRIEERIFPTLVFNEVFAFLPKVVVDMGAVPHVCNGANVMAPGIVRFEGEFGKGDFVSVVDVKHCKTIAIGEAACDRTCAKKATQGIVINSIHFVGDKIWNFIKKTE